MVSDFKSRIPDQYPRGSCELIRSDIEVNLAFTRDTIQLEGSYVYLCILTAMIN